MKFVERAKITAFLYKSSMARRFFRLLPLAFWAVTAGLFFRLLATKLYDPDLWWHLAAGREMVVHHTFLRRDIFSHTLFGAPWVNFEWLSQIVMFLLYIGGGFTALFYAKIFLALTALTGVVVCCWQRGARGPWLVFLAWLAYGLLRPRLLERPELATLNILPIVVLLLLSARTFSTENLKRVRWVLFALMILWCNFHGGFIYGIGLAAFFSVGARWEKESKDIIRFLDQTVLLLLFATLINPNGPRLMTVLAEHLVQLSHPGSVVQEWLPPSVRDLPLFWCLFLVGTGWLVMGILRGRPGARFWAPAFVAFACWGALSYRNAALFAFVALPFIADIFGTQRHPGMPSAFVVLGWALCFILMTFHASVFFRPLPHEMVAWNRFPIGACEFVEQQNIRGLMYNSYDYGGTIEWKLGPERKVFMDGRYIFHPLVWEQALLNEEWLRNPQSRGWQDYWAKYQIDYAIVGHERFLEAMFPGSDWTNVFEDGAALVFVKRAEGPR
jgi:hypothetical protein